MSVPLFGPSAEAALPPTPGWRHFWEGYGISPSCSTCGQSIKPKYQSKCVGFHSESLPQHTITFGKDIHPKFGSELCLKKKSFLFQKNALLLILLYFLVYRELSKEVFSSLTRLLVFTVISWHPAICAHSKCHLLLIMFSEQLH